MIAATHDLRDNHFAMKAIAMKPKQSGFTLIELMVVVAITGGLALVLMSTLVDTTKINRQMQVQAETGRDLQSFYYALEVYFGQTTQVVTCECGGGASGIIAGFTHPCKNDSLQSLPLPAGTNTVLQVVYEDSSDPLQFFPPAAGSNCLLAGAVQIPGTDITPVGCKRFAFLKYTPPVDVSGSNPSTPGKLEISTGIDPAALSPVATINAVTDFACGMTSNPTTGTLSNSDFKVRIDVKSKINNTEQVSDPNYESWSPAGVNFDHGIRRSHFGQVTFRNLTMPGIHFGKMRSYKNCTGNKVATNDPQSCCAGYYDGAACNTSCTPSGIAAPLATMCCSRMIDPTGATGACL